MVRDRIRIVLTVPTTNNNEIIAKLFTYIIRRGLRAKVCGSSHTVSARRVQCVPRDAKRFRKSYETRATVYGITFFGTEKRPRIIRYENDILIRTRVRRTNQPDRSENVSERCLREWVIVRPENLVKNVPLQNPLGRGDRSAGVHTPRYWKSLCAFTRRYRVARKRKSSSSR